MPKTLPKWLTRTLAVVLAALTYLVHRPDIISQNLVWHGVRVVTVISEALAGAAAIGLSGPTLWPQLAALLGNPSAGAVNDAARALDKPVPTAAAKT